MNHALALLFALLLAPLDSAIWCNRIGQVIEESNLVARRCLLSVTGERHRARQEESNE